MSRRYQQGALKSNGSRLRFGENEPVQVNLADSNEIRRVVTGIFADQAISYDAAKKEVHTTTTDEEKMEWLAERSAQLRSMGIFFNDNEDRATLSLSPKEFFKLQLDWKTIQLPEDLVDGRKLAIFANFTQGYSVVIEEPKAYREKTDYKWLLGYDLPQPEPMAPATRITFKGNQPKDPLRYMTGLAELINKRGGSNFKVELDTENPRKIVITNQENPEKSFTAVVNETLHTLGIEVASKRDRW